MAMGQVNYVNYQGGSAVYGVGGTTMKFSGDDNNYRSNDSAGQNGYWQNDVEMKKKKKVTYINTRGKGWLVGCVRSQGFKAMGEEEIKMNKFKPNRFNESLPWKQLPRCLCSSSISRHGGNGHRKSNGGTARGSIE
ncbi:hypothetical protein ACFE04_012637 [Oxalis oulophora]